MIFVDTSVWFSHLVKSDPDFAVVQTWYCQNDDDLLTTDYVLDELPTLLKARGHSHQACSVGERVLMGTICDLHYVTVED